MQTSLRKMGNSTGLIVPRALLGEIGLSVGAVMDLQVKDGKLVASPVASSARAGWANAAEAVAEDTQEAAAWRAFPKEDDSALTW